MICLFYRIAEIFITSFARPIVAYAENIAYFYCSEIALIHVKQRDLVTYQPNQLRL